MLGAERCTVLYVMTMAQECLQADSSYHYYHFTPGREGRQDVTSCPAACLRVLQHKACFTISIGFMVCSQ